MRKDSKVFMFFLLLSLFSINLNAWPWDSPEKKARKLVDELEEFAEELGGVSVGWNIKYEWLAQKISECGPTVVPILIEEVLDTTNAWNFRYLCESRLLFVKEVQQKHARKIAYAYLKIIKNSRENNEIRLNGIRCLSRVAGTRSILKDSTRRSIAKELTEIAISKEESTKLRIEVIENLSRFSKHYGKDIAPTLFSCSEDRSARIRVASISTLIFGAGFGHLDEKVESILVEKFKNSECKIEKDEILFGIKVLKVKKAIPLLIQSLKTGKYCKKDKAAEILGELEAKEAVPELIKIFKSGKYHWEIAKALGKIGDKRAIDPLIEATEKGGAYTPVVMALAKLNAKEAIEPLIECIEGPFGLLKGSEWDAVLALMLLDAREAIPLIERKLSESLKGVTEEQKKGLRIVTENFEKFKRGEKITLEDLRKY